MDKLNRAQKCSILGSQNLGSRGGRAPGPPGSATDLGLCVLTTLEYPPSQQECVKTNRCIPEGYRPVGTLNQIEIKLENK